MCAISEILNFKMVFLCTWSRRVGLLTCILFLNLLELEGSDRFEGNLTVETLMKAELQNFQKDLTKSFVAEHLKKRRSALGFTYEATITHNEPNWQTRLDSSGHTSCIFQGEILIFQSNGIYKVNEHSSKSQLTEVKDSEWSLGDGDIILNCFEWEEKLFVVSSNEESSYSRVHTLQSRDFVLITRQQIRNQGFASAAKFFHHNNDLYLIIAVDNSFHSLTISPIYRWSRTYMDQIHEIQTRGASAVEAFSINSFKYIAIAQRQDAAGNREVGTLLVRMYGRSELEKVQLLWSNEPVALAHLKILKEDYLIIGQSNESSLVYWSTGYDFAFWQSIDGYFGKSLFLDSFNLPNDEPVLLAANEHSVKFYNWISPTTAGTTDLVLNLTSIVNFTSQTERIVNAYFLSIPKVIPETTYLAVTIYQISDWTTKLKIFSTQLSKKEIGPPKIPPENQLSICLTKLKHHLDLDEPSLGKLEQNNDLIITRNKDLHLTGDVVVSNNNIIFLSKDSIIDAAVVKPHIESTEEKYSRQPSEILELAGLQTAEFRDNILSKLDQVVLKSIPGSITGDKTFKSLNIDRIDVHSSSKFELDTLNNVPWSDFENKMLKTHSKSSQIISGNWAIRILTTENFQGGDQIANISIDDFLLTTCGERGRQIIHGTLNFKEDVHFDTKLGLGSFATINDISFSDIAFRHRLGSTEVRGYKYADFINGSVNFEAHQLNGHNMKTWITSLLKIHGDVQVSTGSKIFKRLSNIHNAEVSRINNHDWEHFKETVVLDGPSQTLRGDLDCPVLVISKLTADILNGKHVNDLFTTQTEQDVLSNIKVSELKLGRNILTDTVNDVRISDAVLSTEDAEIKGQLHLQRVSVSDVVVENLVTISSIDISEAAKLPKKHIYRTSNSEPLHIAAGDVRAYELESIALNGISFERIRDAFWRADGENEISGNFDLTAARNVEIAEEFKTETLNALKLESDVVTTTKQQNVVIRRNLKFDAPTFVVGNVHLPDGVTLNDFDFSEIKDQIIRTTDTDRKISGQKHFRDSIEATNGIAVKQVNGIVLEKDLAFLTGIGHQIISGNKIFERVIANEVFSATDVSVKGTVNEEKLNVIRDTTAYNNKKVIIEGEIDFKNNIEAKHFQVQEVNKKRITEILTQSINLTSQQDLAIQLSIHSGTVLFLENSKVHHINGIRPVEYLLSVINRNKKNIINGTKEFHNLTIEGNLDNCRIINGINIHELKNSAFSKTMDQIITGKVRFQEVHSAGNLITEQIDEIVPTDFAQINENSVIESDILFRSEGTSSEGNIRLAGSLNGFKIEDVVERLKSLRGSRKFNSLIINGDLSWEKSNVGLKRISHLREGAVTYDSDQTITHKTTFASGVKVGTIQSKKWINNVDLQAIEQDAVVHNQSPPILRGRNIFLQDLHVSEGSTVVKDKLDTDFINSISLKTISQQVVSIDSTDKTIHGMKTFEEGLSVENIEVGGNIDNINPKDLFVRGDKRTIDQIRVTNTKITMNLDVVDLEGHDLKEIINQRISLSDNQTVFGEHEFEDDAIVEDCSANPINGINSAELFIKDSTFVQNIHGKKTFRNLGINGSVEGTSINGVFLDRLNSQIFRRDQNAVFDRHVTFLDTVLMQDINVTDGINSIHFDQVHSDFSTQLRKNADTIHVSKSTKQTAFVALQDLRDSLKDRAFWLNEYVIPIQYLNVGPRTRVEHSISENENSVIIALHQDASGESGNKCNLPSECYCKSIQFLELGRNNSAQLLGGPVEGLNIFDLRAPSGFGYTVYNHVVSYSQKCTSKSDKAITQISRMRASDQHQGINSKIIDTIETGYVSDTKIFSDNGKDYIVFAQAYNSRSKSPDTLVYEISITGVRKVQTILSSGAMRLALDKVDNTWILIVPNSISESSSADCQSGSKIYQWSTENEEFKLLKIIGTDRAQDVVILNDLKFSKFHNSFVAIAESNTDDEEGREWGRVSIFNCHKGMARQPPSYTFLQTLDIPTQIYALYAIHVKNEACLFVVTKSGIVFYKYSSSEGFKKSGNVQIAEARDTNVISWRGELVFVVASTKKSLLAQSVISGSLEV